MFKIKTLKGAVRYVEIKKAQLLQQFGFRTIYLGWVYSKRNKQKQQQRKVDVKKKPNSKNFDGFRFGWSCAGSFVHRLKKLRSLPPPCGASCHWWKKKHGCSEWLPKAEGKLRLPTPLLTLRDFPPPRTGPNDSPGGSTDADDVSLGAEQEGKVRRWYVSKFHAPS